MTRGFPTEPQPPFDADNLFQVYGCGGVYGRERAANPCISIRDATSFSFGLSPDFIDANGARLTPTQLHAWDARLEYIKSAVFAGDIRKSPHDKDPISNDSQVFTEDVLAYFDETIEFGEPYIPKGHDFLFKILLDEAKSRNLNMPQVIDDLLREGFATSVRASSYNGDTDTCEDISIEESAQILTATLRDKAFRNFYAEQLPLFENRFSEEAVDQLISGVAAIDWPILVSLDDAIKFRLQREVDSPVASLQSEAGAQPTPRRRKNSLSSVIEMAQSRSLDPSNACDVYTELGKLASGNDRPSPLLGCVEDEGVKYEEKGTVKFLTEKMLRKRLDRAAKAR